MPEPSRAQIVDGPKPKHIQLREVLVSISVPGKPIPSERELVETYDVSRATVRKAIDGLVADGMLQRTHGLGTFAIRPRLTTRLHLASFSQDMRRRGRVPSSLLLQLEQSEPPAEVRIALGLDRREQAWHLVRVRLADGEPISQEDGWYPANLLPQLDREDLVTGSLYEVFESRYGLLIDRGDQSLWGEVAGEDLADQLAATPGTPLLVFKRTAYSGGRPIEHVMCRYRGDRYEIHMELSRE